MVQPQPTAKLCVAKVTDELNGSPKTGDNNSKKKSYCSAVFWLFRPSLSWPFRSHPAKATIVNASSRLCNDEGELTRDWSYRTNFVLCGVDACKQQLTLLSARGVPPAI